jgi:hypothetical protein
MRTVVHAPNGTPFSGAPGADPLLTGGVIFRRRRPRVHGGESSGQGVMHTPDVHEGVPRLVSQACPQAPQLSIRVSVFVSQPVAYTWSQSAKGAVQL